MDGPAVLSGRHVLTPDGLVGPARVRIADGRITAIEPVAAADPVTLVPGFVDLQVNGIDDVDVNGPGPVDWDRLDVALLSQGTTTWCPTLVTAPLARYPAKLADIDAASRRPGPRPRIAGAHLEGPFLGNRPGAHRPGWIRAPDLDWLRGLPPVVRLVTLAPEQPGTLDAIALLRDRGVVVAIGHTAATAEQVAEAEAAGASMVTHLFNAMAPLDHRRPGPVGRALASATLVVSLIADAVHVHPDVLRLAARAKGPDRFLLVTDAVAWRAERLGEDALQRDQHDGAARLADGTLAGSTVTMDRAVAVMVEQAGLELGMVLRAASTTPADVLGLSDRGRLAPGCLADVVALDDELRPVSTWVGGIQAWSCR